MLRTGSRTHKNKTGFDLLGLFVGSEGMLGFVTEATLRLLPLPPARATLSASFRTFRQAADAVQAVFRAGFLPSALEIADSFTLQAARDHVGSAAVPAGRGHLLIDLDGQPASVRGEMKSLLALLQEIRCTGRKNGGRRGEVRGALGLAAEVFRVAEGDGSYEAE